MADRVTADQICAGLTHLGVATGDTLMVHSSLSSFGYVEGAAKAVVEAMLSALGPQGTLIAPTFSNYLQGPEEVWDRENTPSLMGAISETVRTWPGAIRSNHAVHPLSAIGPNAELICRTPHETGFGPDSPFKTLANINAWILLMGVTYQNCTLFHLFEAEANVPYRFLEDRKGTVIIDGVVDEGGSAREYTRMEGAINDFLKLGRQLEARGMVRIGKIGEGEQRLFRAGDAYHVGMQKMSQDPLYLLTAESRPRWE